jgi:hypothetical protein
MTFCALAFGLLAHNAGREIFALQQVLVYFRILMTMATVFGCTFTAMYLVHLYRKNRRPAVVRGE